MWSTATVTREGEVHYKRLLPRGSWLRHAQRSGLHHSQRSAFHQGGLGFGNPQNTPTLVISFSGVVWSVHLNTTKQADIVSL